MSFAFLCSVFFVAFGQDGQALLFIALSIGAVVLAINSVNDLYLCRILFFAFLLRFILALVQTYTALNLPGAGADSVVFEGYAWEYASALHQANSTYSLGSAYYYYSATIGLFYYFLGRVELVAQLVNIVAGILIVSYTYKIALHLAGNLKSARLAALLVAIFPTLTFYSAILHREIIIIFTVLYAYYLLLLWLQTAKLYMMISSLLALAVAALFHGPLILLSIINMALLFSYKPLEKRFYFSLRQTAIVALLLIGAVYFSSEFIVYKLPANPLDLLRLEHFQNYVGNRNFGRTHYLVGLIPQSYFDVFWQTPIRVFYFLFAPFPWMVENLIDAMGLLDSWSYFLLSICSIFGFKLVFIKHKIASLCMIAMMLLIITMYAWGTVNYGTAWRHRAKLAPYLIMLASAVITDRSKKFDYLS